jgi:hypothetical protein
MKQLLLSRILTLIKLKSCVFFQFSAIKCPFSAMKCPFSAKHLSCNLIPCYIVAAEGEMERW